MSLDEYTEILDALTHDTVAPELAAHPELAAAKAELPNMAAAMQVRGGREVAVGGQGAWPGVAGSGGGALASQQQAHAAVGGAMPGRPAGRSSWLSGWSTLPNAPRCAHPFLSAFCSFMQRQHVGQYDTLLVGSAPEALQRLDAHRAAKRQDWENRFGELLKVSPWLRSCA